MYRIICRKLLVLIRLAIIVSLAGYSLSNAVAATHSSPSAENQESVSQLMHQADAQVVSDEGHGDFSTDSKGPKLVKQECCNDFCAGFMLVTFQDAPSGPLVSAAREFIDEHGIIGETPGLHRPPRI